MRYLKSSGVSDEEKRDIVIRSIASGECHECGGVLICRNGCYSPLAYIGDTKTNIALADEACVVCGRKVVCPQGHMGGEELKACVHMANVALRATGLFGDLREPEMVKYYEDDTHLADVATGVFTVRTTQTPDKRGRGFSIELTHSVRKTKARDPW